MATLFNESYPWGSRRQELRLCLRALRKGWLSDVQARQIVGQAIEALSDGLLDTGDGASLIKSICIAERRRMKVWEAATLEKLRSQFESDSDSQKG